MGQTNDKPSKRQRAQGKSEQAPRFNSARFVNYELDIAEQAACKGWDVSADDLWSEVSALVDSGYAVSIKYDARSEAYACFVRAGDGEDSANFGLILTGRGSTPAKCVKQAVFKHRKLEGQWEEFAEKRTTVLDD